MARDRQRAKQRRRRTSGDGDQPARPDSRADAVDDLDAARDAGIEDVRDERGPAGSTPAPDPLKHGSSYVDEAKLSEAGAFVDTPGNAAPEHAPDEAEPREEGEYAAGRTGASGLDERAAAVLAAPPGGRVTSFLRASAQELRRVQWPDRRHTIQGTTVTLGFVVLAGGFLGLMDAIWRPIVEAII